MRTLFWGAYCWVIAGSIIVMVFHRYIPMRYIQSMGTFGFANQMYKSTLRFYYGASKDVSVNPRLRSPHLSNSYNTG